MESETRRKSKRWREIRGHCWRGQRAARKERRAWNNTTVNRLPFFSCKCVISRGMRQVVRPFPGRALSVVHSCQQAAVLKLSSCFQGRSGYFEVRVCETIRGSFRACGLSTYSESRKRITAHKNHFTSFRVWSSLPDVYYCHAACSSPRSTRLISGASAQSGLPHRSLSLSLQ